MNDGHLNISRATRFVPLSYYEQLGSIRRAQAGDILYSVTGSFGIPALVEHDEPFVFQRHIALLRPATDTCEPRWLAYMLRAPDLFDQAKATATGTAQMTVPLSGLRTLSVPAIGIGEQRRILAKLDALTARLARLRAELDRVPVLAGRIRAAVLAEAFSGKLAGEDDVVYLPCEQWIASTFYGPRFSKDDYVSEGIPTARTTDFNDDGSMSLATAPRVACSPPDFAKWGLAEGDLLVTRTGSIGKCAVYDPSDGPMLPSAYLIRVRFTPAIITRFAWMMFASPQGQAHLGVNSRAVTQPNINASAIRSLPFPALTLNQQNATISAVDAAFARADRLEAEAARARQLLDRLEAAILARAFRGELVPQDPADEPASVLLDRIRAAAPKAKRGRKAKEEA